MESKDDGKLKQIWRFFRPAPKPKPEPSVAPQRIVLIPSTGNPSPTQNPQNAPRISTGIAHQKPTSPLGSPSKPNRSPITGNPNQMERSKISGEPESGPRKTANLGPLQATGIPSPTQNAPRISIGITHQKPASTLGLPSQPIRGPITGNQNQMERGKIFGEPESGPRRTANFGPWQATISNTCITCGIIAIIVLAILFLLTLAFSIFSLVVFMYNGDFSGNWNHLTTFEPIYEDEVVVDNADSDY
jgi:hypothetical protein